MSNTGAAKEAKPINRVAPQMVRIEIDGACVVPEGDLVSFYSRLSDLLASKGFTGKLCAPSCSECDSQPNHHNHNPYGSPCDGADEWCEKQHHRFTLAVNS